MRHNGMTTSELLKICAILCRCMLLLSSYHGLGHGHKPGQHDQALACT